jgi:hypothetical protein
MKKRYDVTPVVEAIIKNQNLVGFCYREASQSVPNDMRIFFEYKKIYFSIQKDGEIYIFYYHGYELGIKLDVYASKGRSSDLLFQSDWSERPSLFKELYECMKSKVFDLFDLLDMVAEEKL